MQLTGKQIVNNNIVTNVCEEGIQQQGVDLRIKDIKRVVGPAGYIPLTGKTITPQKNALVRLETNSVKHIEWYLDPGYYEVEFLEGCDIKSNMTLHIKTRSSLIRCGAECRSGQFDAGFNTKNMGCFLKVELPIYIDPGARIAQAIVFESYPVDTEDLYNGQWQNDKQRKTQA